MSHTYTNKKIGISLRLCLENLWEIDTVPFGTYVLMMQSGITQHFNLSYKVKIVCARPCYLLLLLHCLNVHLRVLLDPEETPSSGFFLGFKYFNNAMCYLPPLWKLIVGHGCQVNLENHESFPPQMICHVR